MPLSEPVTDGHRRRNQQTFANLIEDDDEHYRWQKEKIALIQSVLYSLKLSGALADVGCFTGRATKLYRDTGFFRAVGFDAAPEVLARAEALGIEPRIWRAGIEDCPAKNEEFNAFIAADVIEHIVDTDWFVQELRRVLHPEGRLIITTPNLAFWMSRLRLLIGKTPWSYPGASPTVKVDEMIDLNHIRVTTRREWEALFRDKNFEVERVHGWSILHAIKGGLAVQARQTIDRLMTKSPDLAFGLLFVLRKKY